MLYRTYTESPDVANMIGIYPKTDSSHGYGNPSTSIKIQSLMRCIETFRRIASIVMALSVCGLHTSPFCMYFMRFMAILCPGIGIRQLHVKMAKNKESG